MLNFLERELQNPLRNRLRFILYYMASNRIGAAIKQWPHMFALRLSAEPLFFAYRVLKLVLLHAMLRVFSAIHVVHDLDFTVCAASLLVLYDSFWAACWWISVKQWLSENNHELQRWDFSFMNIVRVFSWWFYLLTPIFAPSHYYWRRGRPLIWFQRPVQRLMHELADWSHLVEEEKLGDISLSFCEFAW